MSAARTVLVTTAFLPSSTHTIKEKRDKDCAGWECCYENMSKGSNFQDSKIDYLASMMTINKRHK